MRPPRCTPACPGPTPAAARRRAWRPSETHSTCPALPFPSARHPPSFSSSVQRPGRRGPYPCPCPHGEVAAHTVPAEEKSQPRHAPAHPHPFHERPLKRTSDSSTTQDKTTSALSLLVTADRRRRMGGLDGSDGSSLHCEITARGAAVRLDTATASLSSYTTMDCCLWNYFSSCNLRNILRRFTHHYYCCSANSAVAP